MIALSIILFSAAKLRNIFLSHSSATGVERGRRDDAELDLAAGDAAHPLLLLQRHQPRRLPRGRQAKARRGRALHLRVRKGIHVVCCRRHHGSKEIRLHSLILQLCYCNQCTGPFQKSSSSMCIFIALLCRKERTGLFPCTKWSVHVRPHFRARICIRSVEF